MYSPIVILSHPRSGTHLVLDLLRKQFDECRTWKKLGERMNRLYVPLEAIGSTWRSGRMDEHEARELLARVSRPLIKTHWIPACGDCAVPAGLDRGQPPANWTDWLRCRADWVYVVRDGRDVMCSYHPFRASYDASARTCLSDFLRTSIEGRSLVRLWADHVRLSLTSIKPLVLKYEDVLAYPRHALETLSVALHLVPRGVLPLLPAKPHSVWRHRLQRWLSRRPESSAVVARYGAMRVERWREAFTPEDRRFFHAEAGDLLIELGYEADDRWVNS
jgi:hypothetical protein